MNSYQRQRTLNFSLMFLAYGILILCRKSFSYLLPAIILEEDFTRSQLGTISSSLMLAYCISKFVCGILSDQLKPNLFLSIGLIVVGLLNIQFAHTYSVTVFALVWFLNGLGQGAGWPPCTKLLKQWYHPSELGTWWSILSASSNLSGSIGPLVMSAATHYLGWRYVMTIAGCLCMATSTLTFLFITNCPGDVGLSPLGRGNNNHTVGEVPEAETEMKGGSHRNGVKNGLLRNGPEVNGTKVNGTKVIWTAVNGTMMSEVTSNGTKDDGTRQKEQNGTSHNGAVAEQRNGLGKTNGQIDDHEDSKSTVSDVIRSPFLWIISIMFCFVSLQSGAFQNWAQLLLIQDKGFSSVMGSGFTSAYNTGGFIGCISSGYITDRLVTNGAKRRLGSPRLDYMIATGLCNVFCQLCFLKLTTPETANVIVLFFAFTIGFCIFTAVSLLGVLIVENSPVHMSGTAHALGALAGNVGAVSAGLPMSYISSLYDWSMTFTIVLVLAAVGTILMLVCNRIELTIGRSSKIKTR